MSVVRYVPAFKVVDSDGVKTTIRAFLPAVSSATGDGLFLLARPTRREGVKVVWVTHDTKSQDVQVLSKLTRSRVWVRTGWQVSDTEFDGSVQLPCGKFIPQEALELLLKQWTEDGRSARLANEEEMVLSTADSEDMASAAQALKEAEFALLRARHQAEFGSIAATAAVKAPVAPTIDEPPALPGEELFHYSGPAGRSQMTATDIAELASSEPESRHLVWQKGMEGWLRAEDVEVIATEMAEAPPPVPVKDETLQVDEELVAGSDEEVAAG